MSIKNREAPHFIVNIASSTSFIVKSQNELAGLAPCNWVC